MDQTVNSGIRMTVEEKDRRVNRFSKQLSVQLEMRKEGTHRTEVQCLVRESSTTYV